MNKPGSPTLCDPPANPAGLVTFRWVDNLSEAERRTLFGWGVNIFGAPEYDLRWRPKSAHLLVYVEEALVSHVGLLRHEIRVGHAALWVGGVGGVVTLPAYQGQGYARQAMQHAARLLSERLQAPFGLLFCRSRLAPFYGRLGWQMLDCPVIIEQPLGPQLSPLPAMVLTLRGQPWPPGTVELRSLPW